MNEELPIEAIEPEAMDPFELAAERMRRSVRSARVEGDYAKTFAREFIKSAKSMPEKAIQGIDESFAGHYAPEGAAFYNDSGEYLDKDGNVLPLTRKPTIFPATRDPETREIQGAVPGALDVVVTPGGTSGRTASLTAGFRRPGIGHNMGPPMTGAPAGGGPPLPPAAGAAPPPPPPPQPPRQIVRGLAEDTKVTADNLYTAVLDDLHPLKKLEAEAARRGGPLPPEDIPYELGRLTRGTPGRTEQAIYNGTFDFHTLDNNGASLREVLAPISGDRATREAFENFAVAMRDLELHGRGINTGADLATAQATVAAAPQEFRASLQGLYGYQDRMLQYAVDSGIIGREAADHMRQANRNYVPFQRLMDGADKGTRVSKSNIKAWNPIQRIEGSDRDILSPLETVVRNTYALIDLAEKNRALQALERIAQRPGMAGTLTPVPRGVRPHTISIEEMERYFNANGIPVPPQLYGPTSNFTIFRPNAHRPAPDEIAVYHDGKPVVYKVDPEIANAVNGFGPGQMDIVSKVTGAPARWLRAGVVYGPDFLPKNAARDQITAALQSNSFYVPVVSWLEGLGHLMGRTKTYQDFLKSGASNSNFVSMDRKYVDEMIRNMHESGLWNQIKRNVLNPIQGSRVLSDYIEQGTRIGEFAASRRLGRTKHKSGYGAREVSTDFGRHGANQGVQWLARNDPFFSPQLQGVDRFVRAFKDDPGKMALKTSLLIGAPTLMGYVYNRQDPRTADLSPFEMHNYTPVFANNWVPVSPEKAEHYPPNWKKKEYGQDFINEGIPWKMPKAFEYGWAATVIENTLDDYFQKNPDEFKTFVSRLTGKKPDEINNDYFKIKRDRWKDFGKYTSEVFIPPLKMHIATTPREVMNNFSDYRGRPVVPEAIQNPSNRKTEATHYTTETARYIGRVISNLTPESPMASPEAVEYFIKGWTGQIGNLALQISDKAIKGGDNPVTGRWPGARELITGKEEKIDPATELVDVPGMKGFVARLPSIGSRDIGDFYDNYERARKGSATVRRLTRTGNEEGAEEARSEQTYAKLDGAARALANQRRFIEQIMNEHHRKPETWIGKLPMTAEEKRHILNRTLLGMNMIAQHANENYFDLKEQKKQGIMYPQGGGP